MKTWIQFMFFIALGLIILNSYADNHDIIHNDDLIIVNVTGDDHDPYSHLGFSRKEMSEELAEEFNNIKSVYDLSFLPRGGDGLYHADFKVFTKNGREYAIRCNVTVRVRFIRLFSIIRFEDCGNSEVVLGKDVFMQWNRLDEYVYAYFGRNSENYIHNYYRKKAAKRAKEREEREALAAAAELKKQKRVIGVSPRR